jgi:superfamily II DNA or RNA helicase
MPRIIDNIDLKLQPVLQEALAEAVHLDASVGYFNMRGWSVLSDAVDALPDGGNRPPVRLLIGMRKNNPGDDLREELRIMRRQETMDNATAARMREKAAAELREQLCWGIPTESQKTSLLALRRQLVEKRVVVKLFLRHNLHAKLYLCHLNNRIAPRSGFVGSSNLTFSGLGGQGELNVDVLDHDATEKLHKWFVERWDDRFSIDISEELVKIIDESWAAERIIDPYLIYLKLAYHLSRDARAGLIEFGLPESMSRQLLQFQAAAVKITARNLLERGGAIIGDVVGLGKTIVATAVALLLQEEQGFETLILCPKNLVKMWTGYVESFRLHAKVVSTSTAHQELVNLRRYRLVIVDESHNLRNHKTRLHGVVRDYISINDPKVLLLTATPYNTSMDDVANQLRLFIDEDADLGIRPEAALKKADDDGREQDFLRRCDDKTSSLKAFQLSEEDEDWQRLLALFLIRRTRRFIRENYAKLDETNGRYYLLFNNGEKNYLPDRLPLPLPFEASPHDPTSLMVSDQVLGAIDSLKLPRYDLISYFDSRATDISTSEQTIIDDLRNSRGNLLGFTRTMLLKRLSSSGAVFIVSLQRHLLRNYIYLAAIQHRSDLPVGTFDDSQVFSDDDDWLDFAVENPGEQILSTVAEWERLGKAAYLELRDRAPVNIKWIRSKLFVGKLKSQIEEDNKVISGLLKQFGSWDHLNDTKLDALQDLLEEKHPEEKVLIFSEYADTARYVADSLQRRGVTKISAVTGDNDDPTRLARRFSPGSNKYLPGLPVAPEDELRVLVATDVLSEGQNLQDAAIVVNFDLPWAIIKLIQRAGRVDRIGQKASQVHVYTFLPQGGVEEIIKLRSRIAGRLTKLARIFGADERFLNTEGESKLINGLFDESGKTLDDDGEAQVDAASAAYEVWRRAEADHPDLAKLAAGLPDVCFSTRQLGAASVVGEAGVLVYTLSDHGYDRIGFAPEHGEVRQISPQEALVRTECEPSEPGIPPITKHFDMLRSVVEGPLRVQGQTAVGQLSGARKRIYERIKGHLENHPPQLFGPDVHVNEAVDALFSFPLTEHAKQTLSRAMRSQRTEDVLALVVSLHSENRLVINSEADEDDIRIVCSMGFASKGNQ